MPLERLGPYQLDKLLGRGGMGSVYAGRHRETGELAAVKVLSAHLADDAGFRERFKQEIETLKRLLHANIVQLHGFGEEDGHLYYVMELVDGRSLQDELSAGRRFAWREVARIGVAVAEALKHAHDRGIIHRDLKPANLLIDEEDHVKLTDFGIAKLYGGTSVTAEGGVLGTADYMAPEQADGRQITSRCDLYALGSVLFALLTGKPPFGGRSLVQVITALKSEQPPSVRRLAPDTPTEFEAIINQLLEKDPQKRIPTARALANRLKAMEHGLSLETRIAAPGDDGPALVADATSATAATLASAKTSIAPAADATVKVPQDSDKYRLAADNPTLATSGGPSKSSRTALGTQAGKPTGADSSRCTDVTHASSVGAAPSAAPPAKVTRFTTVDARELQGRRERDHDVVWQWVGLSALVAAGLGLLAGGAYFAMRPPSADQQFAAITEVAASGDATALAAIEPQLAQFLDRHAADPRAAEVRGYLDDLERSRLQKRFERQARRAGAGEKLTPIEQAYLEAMQAAASDPAAALAKFEAIVSLFGEPGAAANAAPGAERRDQVLKLSGEQIETLRPAVQALQAATSEEIRRQLQRAAEIATHDAAAAAKIYQGIVTLYAAKRWARDLVAEAQDQLQRVKPPDR